MKNQVIRKMKTEIPIEKWIWKGDDGHFIGWSHCHFRLCTVVGKFKISTVGCYHSSQNYGHATDYNKERLGSGDNSFYETMVNDGTGWKDQTRYGTAEQAQIGHLKMCRKYSKKSNPKGEQR